MRNSSKKDKPKDLFKSAQFEILVAFAVIITIVILFIDYVILEKSKKAMQENASNLVAANSRQIELNINSYLERMETIPTLLFSDKNYYLYDATDESLDEYDKVKSEEEILNRIVDIGLMENYSDFGIVYSNGHTVGWISHGTDDMFPEGGLYEAFSEYIENSKKNDGWCFGLNGCIDRIYYIKRLNENALLESATYTRELESVFIYPEQIEDMTIRLVDTENVIIFSSDESEIGTVLPYEISNEIQKKVKKDADMKGIDHSIIGDRFIINTNECKNGWKVICSVPTEVILKDNIELRKFTIVVSVGLALVFLLVGFGVISNIYRPVDGMVTFLQKRAEIDELSGVLNRAAFQDAVEQKLSEKKENDIAIVVMLDADNFKQVNDKLGHAHGDQVIIRTGELLKRVFGDDDIVGRVGGDEFAIFSECKLTKDDMDDSSYDSARDTAISVLKNRLEVLKEEYSKTFEVEMKNCNISLSAGVYVSDKRNGASEDFKLMYDKADKALYESKNNGKDRYTIYEEG